jgi:hypothetical protein
MRGLCGIREDLEDCFGFPLLWRLLEIVSVGFGIRSLGRL